METTTQPQNIPISTYDNQISILYRAAIYFETPTRYITVRDRQPDDVTTETSLVIGDFVYQPFLDVLGDYITQHPSLQQAYQSLVGSTGTIDRQDFALIYFTLSQFRQWSEQESFDLIQDFLGKDAFRGLNDLRVRHTAWIARWTEELQEDEATLEQILDIQSDLEAIPEEYIKPTTDLVVDRVTLRSYPTLISGRRPEREDGPSIFDGIQMSYFLPYARYNEGVVGDSSIIRKVYSKIYRGEATTTDVGFLGAEPNLGMIIPIAKTKAINKGNIIYATIWTGNDDQVITRPTREGYTKVIYDLDSGILTFKTRVSEKNPLAKELLIERVSAAFPHLNLGEITETRISGEFDLYLDSDLQDYVLLHEILNNPTFTAYLYVDERQKAYPEKKRITIHYRSILGEAAEETSKGSIGTAPASISAVLNQRYSTDDQANQDHPVGTPYLRVSITRGASRQVAEQFRQIFTLLMGIYLQDRDEIIQTYNEYIPTAVTENPDTAPKKRRIKIRTGKARRIIYQLQDAAPHIFIPGYARRCQGHLQPLVISPEEVPDWEAKQFRDKNRELRNRQVMPFPPAPNSEIIVVCPDDRAPYPGVKENQLSNSTIYPYIPCCNETDQTVVGKKTNYNAYYRGTVVEAKGEKRRMKIITAKILFSGGTGEIPVPLERVLLRYSETASSFKRFGVIRDANSFLHCVLEALNYGDYTTRSEADKIALVLEIRRSIPEQVHLAVMKQELYDFSLDDIEAQVAAEELFFDPTLYYRAVEEFFNVNIYTFSPGKKPKEDRGETIGKIDVPRSKLFHSRPLRLGRPTILIYKHWGAEADALEYPQCELLIDYTKQTRSAIKIFDDAMTEVVHRVLTQTYPITTWSYQEGSLVNHRNLYSRVNFDQLTGQQAVAQVIDDYGKMRGLVIPYEGQNITIFVLPSQPENLPLVEELIPTTGPIAEALFGQPIGIGLNDQQNQVIGLWFDRPEIPDYPYVIFVPIESTTNYLNLDQGPSPPLDLLPPIDQTSSRVLRLQRQISILLQIIRWLFLLFHRSVDVFMTELTEIYQGRVEDSSLFYDLSSIPHRLPDVTTAQDGIDALSTLAPTLARNGRIILYSTVFSQKIRDHLNAFVKQTQGLQVEPSRYLDNYYVYESDFRPQPRTVILIGQDNLNTWLTSLQRAGHRGIQTVTSLEVGFAIRTEPYLYTDEDGITYMIQNVEGSEIARSLQVAVSWYTQLTNPGFAATPIADIETIPYRVYEISPSSALRIKEEQTDPETNPDEVVEILEYSDGVYAALLPLATQDTL